MSHRSLATLAIAAVFILAACSSSTASTAASGAPAKAASAAAPSAAAPSAAGAQVCNETKDAGAVAVTIIDFEFQPAAITAKTGQVITFTNGGSAPHTATLDGGQCATPTLTAGKSDGLVFSAAGTYPFHCGIHSKMKGSIVIS